MGTSIHGIDLSQLDTNIHLEHTHIPMKDSYTPLENLQSEVKNHHTRESVNTFEES